MHRSPCCVWAAVVAVGAAIGTPAATTAQGRGEGGAGPPRVERLGAHKDYGPGIMEASLDQLRFELTQAAHVIVLRVYPDGGIEPLRPLVAQPPSASEVGAHVVTAASVLPVTNPDTRPLDPVLTRQGLERVGRVARPPAAGAGDEPSATAYWWLVVVSDVPASAADVAAVLATFTERRFSSVRAEVRALPRELVGRRTRRWGAYYTAVEP